MGGNKFLNGMVFRDGTFYSGGISTFKDAFSVEGKLGDFDISEVLEFSSWENGNLGTETTLVVYKTKEGESRRVTLEKDIEKSDDIHIYSYDPDELSVFSKDHDIFNQLTIEPYDKSYKSEALNQDIIKQKGLPCDEENISKATTISNYGNSNSIFLITKDGSLWVIKYIEKGGGGPGLN